MAVAWTIAPLKIPYKGWEIPVFELPSRGVWAVVGPNGAGKSQFFHQLISWSLHTHLARIGLAAQNPLTQLTESTVWQQMTWPFHRRRQRLAGEIEERASQLLGDWHLTEYRDQAPWQLSGGQQRRLVLASIELLAPEVYLLDEPLEGLDGLHREVLEQKIRQWANESSVLVSSHAWNWLLGITESGWWCEDGLAAGNMGALWYHHGNVPGNRLETLWRRLLDAQVPVDPRAWIDPQWARGEVKRLWSGYLSAECTP